MTPNQTRKKMRAEILNYYSPKPVKSGMESLNVTCWNVLLVFQQITSQHTPRLHCEGKNKRCPEVMTPHKNQQTEYLIEAETVPKLHSNSPLPRAVCYLLKQKTGQI